MSESSHPEADYTGCARKLLDAGAVLEDSMRTYGTEEVRRAIAEYSK